MLFPAGSFVWTNTTDAVALSACAAAANATAAARTPSKIARFIVPPRVDVRRRPSRGLARNAGQARSSETVKNSPSEGLGSADEAGRGATLSFNWRRVLAPFEVLDYVIVHELCHLQVLDHSQRFWQLVEQHRPHWRRQRDWLRMHGPELLAFEACD